MRKSIITILLFALFCFSFYSAFESYQAVGKDIVAIDESQFDISTYKVEVWPATTNTTRPNKHSEKPSRNIGKSHQALPTLVLKTDDENKGKFNWQLITKPDLYPTDSSIYKRNRDLVFAKAALSYDATDSKYEILKKQLNDSIATKVAKENAETPKRIQQTITIAAKGNDTVVNPSPTLLQEGQAFRKKVTAKIIEADKEIQKYDYWALALTVLTTIFAGISALLTAISTIKNQTITKGVAITVAVLTFFTTVTSCFPNYVNLKKKVYEDQKKTAEKVKADFDALKFDALEAQLPSLNNRLDDILI